MRHISPQDYVNAVATRVEVEKNEKFALPSLKQKSDTIAY